MMFHENCLPADNSYEISCLTRFVFFLKKRQNLNCHNALFVIFEKAAKFEIVVCCKLQVALKGLIVILKGDRVAYLYFKRFIIMRVIKMMQWIR